MQIGGILIAATLEKRLELNKSIKTVRNVKKRQGNKCSKGKYINKGNEKSRSHHE